MEQPSLTSVNIQSLFKLMIEQNASDLHLSTGAPPGLRIDGTIINVKTPPLTKEQSKHLIYQVLTKNQRALFEKNLDLDFSFEIKGLARFRANIFFSKGSVSAVFRQIPATIPSFNSLHLPHILLEMIEINSGLILVTGQTGIR